MKLTNDEVVFILNAVDGVRSGSTVEARIKGQLLGKLAVELELRGQVQEDVDQVSDE